MDFFPHRFKKKKPQIALKTCTNDLSFRPSKINKLSCHHRLHAEYNTLFIEMANGGPRAGEPLLP